MKLINKVVAWILFVGAFTGLIFSGYGVVIFHKYEKVILNDVLTSLELLDQTLTTTNDGLSLVGDAVLTAKGDLELIVSLTYEISDAIGNTELTLASVSGLFGEDLITIIENTQTSLQAAETSAMLIDDTLKIISAIPLLGARYAPAQPLGESVAQVSTSLDSLPTSLSDIEEGLDSTAEDLAGIETTVFNLAERIGEIDSTLEEANIVIENYHGITSGLQENLGHLKEEIPNWFNRISLGVSVLFAWVGIASLGLFAIGTLMIKQANAE